MTGKRKDQLPPPQVNGVQNNPLNTRFSMSPATAAEPARTQSAPARTSGTRGYGRGTGKSRPDPAGMCRESFYLSVEARDALAAAVDQVVAALGGDVPKHVAISALIAAGAAQSGRVAADLAADRAKELAAQIEALNNAGA